MSDRATTLRQCAIQFDRIASNMRAVQALEIDSVQLWAKGKDLAIHTATVFLAAIDAGCCDRWPDARTFVAGCRSIQRTNKQLFEAWQTELFDWIHAARPLAFRPHAEGYPKFVIKVGEDGEIEKLYVERFGRRTRIDNRGDDAFASVWRDMLGDWIAACEVLADLVREQADDQTDDQTNGANAIVSLGKAAYQAPGHRPYRVSAEEDAVLNSFLTSPAMNQTELASASGYRNPVKTLRDLKDKYGGAFAPFIELPGGKGCGGYHVRIVAGESQPASQVANCKSLM